MKRAYRTLKEERAAHQEQQRRIRQSDKMAKDIRKAQKLRQRPPSKAIPAFAKELEQYQPLWRGKVLRVIEVRADLDPQLLKLLADALRGVADRVVDLAKQLEADAPPRITHQTQTHQTQKSSK